MYIHVGIKYWLKVVLLLFSINANGSNTNSYNLRGSYTIHNNLQLLETPRSSYTIFHFAIFIFFFCGWVEGGGLSFNRTVESCTISIFNQFKMKSCFSYFVHLIYPLQL